MGRVGEEAPATQGPLTGQQLLTKVTALEAEGMGLLKALQDYKAVTASDAVPPAFNYLMTAKLESSCACLYQAIDSIMGVRLLMRDAFGLPNEPD